MVIAISVVVILVIFIVFNIIAEHAFKKAFLRPRKTKEESIKLLKERYMYDGEIYNEVEFKPVNINSIEGFRLQGYLIEEFKESNKYVILVHGYTANYHLHVPFVREFLKLGYNVLLVDARNHGESEGNINTYGYYEKNDLDRWIEFLEEYTKRELFIGIHGQSMGAATALMCGSKNSKVKFVVDDCGYTDGVEIIKYQIGKVKNIPFKPTYLFLNYKTKKRCNFNFEEVSPRRDILSSNIPVLFIHGTEDKTVPVNMSIDLYNERKGPLDDILVVKGAVHLNSIAIDREGYVNKLKSFLERIEKG